MRTYTKALTFFLTLLLICFSGGVSNAERFKRSKNVAKKLKKSWDKSRPGQFLFKMGAGVKNKRLAKRLRSERKDRLPKNTETKEVSIAKSKELKISEKEREAKIRSINAAFRRIKKSPVVNELKEHLEIGEYLLLTNETSKSGDYDLLLGRDGELHIYEPNEQPGMNDALDNYNRISELEYELTKTPQEQHVKLSSKELEEARTINGLKKEIEVLKERNGVIEANDRDIKLSASPSFVHTKDLKTISNTYNHGRYTLDLDTNALEARIVDVARKIADNGWRMSEFTLMKSERLLDEKIFD